MLRCLGSAEDVVDGPGYARMAEQIAELHEELLGVHVSGMTTQVVTRDDSGEETLEAPARNGAERSVANGCDRSVANGCAVGVGEREREMEVRNVVGEITERNAVGGEKGREERNAVGNGMETMGAEKGEEERDEIGDGEGGVEIDDGSPTEEKDEGVIDEAMGMERSGGAKGRRAEEEERMERRSVEEEEERGVEKAGESAQKENVVGMNDDDDSHRTKSTKSEAIHCKSLEVETAAAPAQGGHGTRTAGMYDAVVAGTPDASMDDSDDEDDRDDAASMGAAVEHGDSALHPDRPEDPSRAHGTEHILPDAGVALLKDQAGICADATLSKGRGGGGAACAGDAVERCALSLSPEEGNAEEDEASLDGDRKGSDAAQAEVRRNQHGGTGERGRGLEGHVTKRARRMTDHLATAEAAEGVGKGGGERSARKASKAEAPRRNDVGPSPCIGEEGGDRRDRKTGEQKAGACDRNDDALEDEDGRREDAAHVAADAGETSGACFSALSRQGHSLLTGTKISGRTVGSSLTQGEKGRSGAVSSRSGHTKSSTKRLGLLDLLP